MIFVIGKGNYLPILLLTYRIATFFKADVNDIFTYVESNNQNED